MVSDSTPTPPANHAIAQVFDEGNDWPVAKPPHGTVRMGRRWRM